jgi:hypothetical protein
VNAAQQWWLQNTTQGRRLLSRMVPNSALPYHTRRRICADQGHDTHSTRDGRCARCGDELPTEGRRR